MSLATNISTAFTRVATESKALRTLINGNQSNLSALNTTAKSNLVAAINELVSSIGEAGASINDSTISTSSVWSSSKTEEEIDAAISALVNAAPGLLDTLDEIAQALGDDPNFATTITNALALKAPLASPTFTGTVTVPDGSFTIAKTTGLQAALDGKITGFADPNSDRIVFWDDSVGAYAALALSGLSISGTTLSVDAASETVQGKVELATLAEMGTGTDTQRAATPAGVRQEINTRAASSHTHTASNVTDFSTAADARVNALVPAATESTAGKVELATAAETTTGSDNTRAVHPAGLKVELDKKSNTTHGHALTDANITGVLPIAQVPTGTSGTTVALGNHGHTMADVSDASTAIPAAVPAASETVQGKVELATNAEVLTGTDTQRAITPSGFRNAVGDTETNFVTIYEAGLV